MQTLLEIISRAGGWNPGLSQNRERAVYGACDRSHPDESGPGGLPAISVAHYGEQNGDLMRDPEMCFELGSCTMSGSVPGSSLRWPEGRQRLLRQPAPFNFLPMIAAASWPTLESLRLSNGLNSVCKCRCAR
jgi:hypothetical protein